MREMGWLLLSELPVYLRLVVRVLPMVRRELSEWKSRASGIPDDELRRQALSSISSKAFHCMGGSVLALLNPERLQELVKAIVAIQTVSDYLDNLCDRASASSTWANDPSMAAARKGFLSCMTIHEAFRCAVDPTRSLIPFYRMYPVAHPGGDGGYLRGLVEASRDVLRDFALYDAALPWVNYLAGLYCELQSIKHLSPAVRNALMEEWHRARWVGDLNPAKCSLPLPRWASQGLSGVGKETVCGNGAWGPPLAWWEFAAATGSTLGIFALMCASSLSSDAVNMPGGSTCEQNGSPGDGPVGDLSDTTRLRRKSVPLHIAGQIGDIPEPGQAFRLPGSYHVPGLFVAYFPFICGLHILLDYYIDREEDRRGGDLNFVSFYPSSEAREAGLYKFVDRALDAASSLPHSWLHLAVVRGLLAMYLSDPKVGAAGLSSEACALAMRGGPLVRVLRPACGVIRRILGF